jgi:hypothetical protein
MDPHPLANLFKQSNYDEPIASELSAVDYLYEVLLENHESENCDEVLKDEIYKVIHDSSSNEKHDCNDIIINSINVNCANDMQSYKLGDDNFVISTTYCNDHDWGDNASSIIPELVPLNGDPPTLHPSGALGDCHDPTQTNPIHPAKFVSNPMDPFQDPHSIAHQLDFSFGHQFRSKVCDLFSSTVNPVYPSSGFILVASFG